jgi:hypothetical protein
MRRKEKQIESREEMVRILKTTKYVTIALCSGNEPYLVTLSHGYDSSNNCIYFHCAKKGKKIDLMKENSIIWGQALEDLGYAVGSCDHLYATVHFRGTVALIDDLAEKEHALRVMIEALEPDPEKVVNEQVNEKSLRRVGIGRIDIDYMTGKKSDEVIISM